MAPATSAVVIPDSMQAARSIGAAPRMCGSAARPMKIPSVPSATETTASRCASTSAESTFATCGPSTTPSASENVTGTTAGATPSASLVRASGQITAWAAL